MSPGRELDKKVAVEVMNWTWPEDGCPTCGWPFAKAQDGGCRPGDCSQRPLPNPPESEKYPHYSTRISDAMQIVDQKMPQFVCERLIGGCKVLFFHQNERPVEVTVRDEDHDMSFDKRLAWAVCLCALKAVGVEVQS